MQSIGKYQQMPNDEHRTRPKLDLPIDAVDRLADQLVDVFNNKKFRDWYCGVIYEFGFSQVLEWQSRASTGKEPAKLFSTYVKQARTYGAGKLKSDANN